jgi:hypothetical protein
MIGQFDTPAIFIPIKYSQVPGGWVGHRGGLDVAAKIKIPTSTPETQPCRLVSIFNVVRKNMMRLETELCPSVNLECMLI